MANTNKTPPKILIISKNVSNKGCVELNFLQKTHLKHISIYPRNGDGDFQKFAIFEILFNAQELKSRFILGLNAGKDIDYIEKCFKQKLS